MEAPRNEKHLLHRDGIQGRAGSAVDLERLRDEQRFASVDELVAAIKRDIARARTLLDVEVPR